MAATLFDRHLRDWVGLSARPPDGSQVDLTLFLVEAGAAVAPGPFLATAGLFVPLLIAAGHDLAGPASTGEVTGTVAIAGADGVWQANGDPVRTQVIDADLVDHVAVVLPGPSLAVVPAGDLDRVDIETLDLARRLLDGDGARRPDRRSARRRKPSTTRSSGRRSPSRPSWSAWRGGCWTPRSRTPRSGCSSASPSARSRPSSTSWSTWPWPTRKAAAAVAYASMCIDADDPDRHRAVHVAKATAGLAARKTAWDGLQTHGGIGFTWEHDLHFRLRRAYADDALCGTHEWHLDRLADLIMA